MKKYTVEICANSVLSVRNAREGGADRVELCAALPLGGVTPSYGEIAAARDVKGIALNVLVRPRSGDFLYTESEIDVMLRDIELCQRLGVDGVVVGALRPNGDIDSATMQRLMEASKGLSVTFHRAFDMCRNPLEALEEVAALGCHRILTSGLAPNAVAGIPTLSQLVARAAGRLIVMPGGGIGANNILKLAKETGAMEFHLSASSPLASQMEYRNPAISMGGDAKVDEYATTVSDVAKVRRVVALLSEYGR